MRDRLAQILHRVADRIATIRVGAPDRNPLASFHGDQKSLQRNADRPQAGGLGVSIQHEGWDLTPERLMLLYQRAEHGWPQGQCDAIDDCVERDLTLASLAEGRTAALLSKNLVFLPGSAERESFQVAELWREVWGKLDGFAFLERQQQQSLLHGWSGDQIVWTWNPEQRRHDPTSLQPYRPRDFLFATDRKSRNDDALPGEPLLRRDGSDFYGQRLLDGRWLFTRKTSAAPSVRGGLGRGSALWSLIKSVTSADWTVFVRRFGIPFVLAQVNDWTSAQERALAATIIQAVGTDTGAVVAKNSGVELTFHDGAPGARTATSDIHARLVTVCDNQLAKRWNGAALASEAGDGASSFALAKEHGGIRFELILADARRLAFTLQYLVWLWHTINDLPGAPPRAVFHLVRITDPKTYAETAAIVSKELGIPLSAESVLEAVGMRGGSGTDTTNAISL